VAVFRFSTFCLASDSWLLAPVLLVRLGLLASSGMAGGPAVLLLAPDFCFPGRCSLRRRNRGVLVDRSDGWAPSLLASQEAPKRRVIDPTHSLFPSLIV
jgi:hypothetical protein